MGERVGAGADPGAGSGDVRGAIERKLIQIAAAPDTGIVATPGERGYLQRLICEAADALGEARRALEAVDGWLDRCGQGNEEGYFFRGLPAPEVGGLALKVRGARARLEAIDGDG